MRCLTYYKIRLKSISKISVAPTTILGIKCLIAFDSSFTITNILIFLSRKLLGILKYVNELCIFLIGSGGILKAGDKNNEYD